MIIRQTRMEVSAYGSRTRPLREKPGTAEVRVGVAMRWRSSASSAAFPLAIGPRGICLNPGAGIAKPRRHAAEEIIDFICTDTRMISHAAISDGEPSRSAAQRAPRRYPTSGLRALRFVFFHKRDCERCHVKNRRGGLNSVHLCYKEIPVAPSGLPVDRVLLSTDPRTLV